MKQIAWIYRLKVSILFAILFCIMPLIAGGDIVKVKLKEIGIQPQAINNETQEALGGFEEEDTADSDIGGFEENTGDMGTNTDEKDPSDYGLSGEIKQQVAYLTSSKNSNRKDFSSLRKTFFLDYEYKFSNDLKLKINERYFYDWVYDISHIYFTPEEKYFLYSEAELFDAYLEGSVSNSLDFKIGRQVVVWGRSDTIRITDVLNPIDNRQPGMVDIKDLRLPTVMVKLDYYVGNWRITPIVLLEQRFTKDPPYGSTFYPANFPFPDAKEYNKPTYALSIGREFHGWDMNLYATHIYNDTKFIQDPFSQDAVVIHDKINMFGAAFNILKGSWLIKSEIAYFDALRYMMAPDTNLNRLDTLIGIEYNGIANTMISFDASLRHFMRYDMRLERQYIIAENKRIDLIPTYQNTYQYAFRMNSDFINDTLHANYLITLFGKKGNEGGFQRLWATYDIDDHFKMDVGILDFIGGDILFDHFKQERIVFGNIIYNFNI
ncbi:MAG: DUF1302 domain-containing protein [Sulfurovum sp.]|nr:DUF1302 domain-containing protein [Sulfurovum sp.]